MIWFVPEPGAYFVSTVGRDEEVICACIRNQEKEDEQLTDCKPPALTGDGYF